MPSRSKKTIAAPFSAVDIDTIKKATPYIQRLIQDAQLRQNVRTAFDSSRSAYARLSNGKPATKVLIEDKKLQRELREAANALRDASSALGAPPKRRRRRGGLKRSLLLLAVAGALALVLSEGLRSKVLDLLFGAEEEFDYSSSTAPAEPAPVGAPAA